MASKRFLGPKTESWVDPGDSGTSPKREVSDFAVSEPEKLHGL